MLDIFSYYREEKMKKLIALLIFSVLIIIGGLYLPAGSQPIPTGFDATAVHVGNTLSGDATATFEQDGDTPVTVTDFTITGEAAGDVIYFNGTNWIRLAKGTAAQALKMNSGATAPEWGTVSSVGISDEAYGATWNGITATATSKNAIYDYLVNFDADSDGSFLDETWLTTWPGSASITTIGTITTGTWRVANGIELATATTASNYKTFYSDGSGDVQELANGTNTWILTSQGTGTVPHWAAQHAESHNVASHSDTSGTGAELNTLTDNSIADTLHRHTELVASDGTPDPALSVDSVGRVGIGTAAPEAKLHIENFFAAPPDDLGDFDNYHLVILGEINTGRHAGMLFSTDINTYGGSAIVHYDTGAGGVGDLVFYTKQSISAIPPVEVMRLDDAGDVIATGALEAAVLTEGGVAVYNLNELNEWAGSASITTLGSIVAGTWNGTAIALGASTSGNYIATIADAGSGTINVIGSGSEGASITLEVASYSITNIQASSTLISGQTDVTAVNADYFLIWDATDGLLKKVDMAEVLGGGSSGFGGWTHDGSNVFSGSTTTSWTDIDLSGTVGSDYAMVMLRVTNDDAGKDLYDVMFRPNGATEGYDAIGSAGGYQLLFGGTNTTAVFVLETGSDGIIEWASNETGEDIEIYLEGYVTTASSTVSDGTYGATWNGSTTTAPSSNAVYDYLIQLDSEADGVITLGSNTAGNYIATLTDSGSSTFTIVRSGAETASVTIALNQDSVDDEHINWGTPTGQVDAADIPLFALSNSSWTTVQHMQNVFHSAGWITGGNVTDDGDGTISVALGTGLIRALNDDVETLYFFDWAAEAGANVALVDNDINYIYAEYNSGAPRVIATNTESADYHTNVLLGLVQASGTSLHINTVDKHTVGDHASRMIRRLKDTMAFSQVTGGILSATGTLGIQVTAGEFWQGLTEFSTNSFDSGSGTFSYWHIASPTGFIQIADQQTISATQYDDGDGTLGTLSNNKYGVHWVYMEVDSHIDVLYGRGDYTLSEAEDAQPPATVPEPITTHGFLISKIIIKKSDSAFTQVESTFQTTFVGSQAQDHGNLAGLADAADHTYALLIDGTRALAGAWDMNNDALTNVNIDSGVFTGITSASITGNLEVGDSLTVSASLTIPNGTDPDISVAGQISYDTDDLALRGYNAVTGQFIIGQATKTIQFTIAQPDDLDEKDDLLVWTNETGFVFIITTIKGWCNAASATFALVTASPTNFDAETTIESVTLNLAGTGVYYDTIIQSAIDHYTISNGDVIIYDPSTFDAAWIKVSIIGYLDAD